MASVSVQRKRRASADIRALAAEVGFESAAVSLRPSTEFNRQQFDGLVSELHASPHMTPDQSDRLSQVVLVYNGQAVVGCRFLVAERVIFLQLQHLHQEPDGTYPDVTPKKSVIYFVILFCDLFIKYQKLQIPDRQRFAAPGHIGAAGGE